MRQRFKIAVLRIWTKRNSIPLDCVLQCLLCITRQVATIEERAPDGVIDVCDQKCQSSAYLVTVYLPTYLATFSPVRAY